MKILKTVAWASLSVAVLGAVGGNLFLAGCSRDQEVTVPAPPGPAAAAQAPAGDPQPQYVIVQQAPPPAIVEVQPAPPPGSQVWIEGSWHWNNQRYNWQAGRYEAPPQAGATWVAARYEPESHGFRYTQGQWKLPQKGRDQDHERDGH